MAKGVALITGASGQDGWYLMHYLRGAGYDVHAQSRNGSPHCNDERFTWHLGELTDAAFLHRLVAEIKPDEIYNLAAISVPQLTWKYPVETAAINALLPQQLCELIGSFSPGTRLFQASSSEMLQAGPDVQDENSPLKPLSPYGVAKAYAHHIIGAYRAHYGLHLSAGILFNHESPRRPLKFVSQKIAHAAACISVGILNSDHTDERGLPIIQNGIVRLGSLQTRRDFGFAGDYVEAMHAIVNHHEGDDYVIGTGNTHSVAEFCEIAFRHVGLNWQDHVIVDEALIRKSDNHTRANPKKIIALLGHEFKTSFETLVCMMVDARREFLERAG